MIPRATGLVASLVAGLLHLGTAQALVVAPGHELSVGLAPTTIDLNDAAPADGLFDRSVEVQSLGSQGGVSRALASQTVTLDSARGASGRGLATLELQGLDATFTDIPSLFGVHGVAGSGYLVLFDIGARAAFSLNAALFGDGDGRRDAGVRLVRQRSGADELLLSADLTSPTLQAQGFLDPGRYFLGLSASVAGLGRDDHGSSGFEFDFHFEPAGEVPEPSSLALQGLALGLALAAGRRRRRSNKALHPAVVRPCSGGVVRGHLPTPEPAR